MTSLRIYKITPVPKPRQTQKQNVGGEEYEYFLEYSPETQKRIERTQRLMALFPYSLVVLAILGCIGVYWGYG